MSSESTPKLYRLKASVTDKQLRKIGISWNASMLRSAMFAISAVRSGFWGARLPATPTVTMYPGPSYDGPDYSVPLSYIKPAEKAPGRRKLIAAIRSAKLSAVPYEKLSEAVRLLGLSV